MAGTTEQAEKSIEALLGWIGGLQVQIDTLERRLERQEKSTKRVAKCADLKAENRTLRLALRDAMSYKRASLEDAQTAMVAITAPEAQTAKKDREDG